LDREAQVVFGLRKFAKVNQYDAKEI